jgi:diguanylate cyclase (GGDEF)-like protein
MSSATKILKGKLTVSELMSRELVTVPLGTPLAKVAKLLTEGHSRHVLVTDAAGGLAGVVSDRDVLRHLMPGESDAANRGADKSVESIMVTKFVASNPEANPIDLAAALGNGAVECLPILEGGKLVGVMTTGDLLLSWNRLRPVLQQAGVDHLTGVASRSTFDRRLAEELERARRQQLPMSVIMFDVDHFKQINDTCGHLTGDAILRLVADCLTRHLRSYDVLARFGGDEFAAICSACGAAEIEAPIRRVQSAIRSISVPAANGRRGLTLSIGAAIVPPGARHLTPAQLIRAADRSLYQAKDGGRDAARFTELGEDGTEHGTDRADASHELALSDA